MTLANKGSIGLILWKLLVLVVAVLFLVPVVLTVYRSFVMDGSVSLQGYGDLLFDCFIFYRLFWNSVFYGLVITLVQLLVIVPAAFAFHFASFRGKQLLFLSYIIMMMMPLQVMILPNYIGLRDMGLLNTRLAIILPMVFSPFGVVVLHQYVKGIDHSIVEALRLETKSMVMILIHGVVPQIRVCILAVLVFVFADCWNMVEQPMLFLEDANLKTLTTFIVEADKYTAGIMFPASVLFMAPVLLFYLLFHSELEKGLRFL